MPPDVVRFRLKRVPRSGGTEVEVVINERPLSDLIAEIEKPFAKREGHPEIAGSYSLLDTRHIELPVTDHFRGLAGSDLDCGPADKTVLLSDAGCGMPACWPLMARIRVEDDAVIWSHFEQPHRREKWSYGDLQFTFSRDQYEAELAKLGRRYGWRGKK